MKLRKLLEEFKKGFKSGGKYYEIFVNPAPKEIESVIGKHGRKSFRFFATQKKKLYVFSSNLLHAQAADHLDDIVNSKIDRPLGGVAMRKNGRYIIESIHNYGLVKVLNNLTKWAKDNWKNWKWLEEYKMFPPEA